MSKNKQPGYSFKQIFEGLANRKEMDIITLPAMPMMVDRYDGAAAKAVLAAMRALGPDARLEEIDNTLATAWWWVRKLLLDGQGIAIQAELERLQPETPARD